MKKVVIYVHGKDGSIEEANHFRNLFLDYEVIGFDYKSNNPWDAKEEFGSYFEEVHKEYDSIILIANSIGAYFSLGSINDKYIKEAYLISPIVDVEFLIRMQMKFYNITEEELERRKVYKTTPDDEISWEYLTYVRNHPIKWNAKTNILYGSKDFLMPYDVMNSFVDKIKASLTIMEDGEHWFHTKEQMEFLDSWIIKCRN